MGQKQLFCFMKNGFHFSKPVVVQHPFQPNYIKTIAEISVIQIVAGIVLWSILFCFHKYVLLIERFTPNTWLRQLCFFGLGFVYSDIDRTRFFSIAQWSCGPYVAVPFWLCCIIVWFKNKRRKLL